MRTHCYCCEEVILLGELRVVLISFSVFTIKVHPIYERVTAYRLIHVDHHKYGNEVLIAMVTGVV